MKSMYVRVSKIDGSYEKAFCNIKRDVYNGYLSKVFGVGIRQVQKITKDFAKNIFTYKDEEGFKSVRCFTIPIPKENYVLIHKAFFFSQKYDRKVKHLFVEMAKLCFNDTLTVKYSLSELAEKFGVKEFTMKKYISKLKRALLISVNNGVIKILKYVKPIKKDNLNKPNRKLIKKIIQNPSNTKLFKQVIWFLDKGIHLTRKANEIFTQIVTGYLGKPVCTYKKQFSAFAF